MVARYTHVHTHINIVSQEGTNRTQLLDRPLFFCRGGDTVRINLHDFVKRPLCDSSGIRQGHGDGLVDSFSQVLEPCPGKSVFIKFPR